MRKLNWKIGKKWKLPKGKYLQKLDWYIIRKFLGTYIFAIGLIISIAVVFDFNEKMDNFMEHDAPWTAIVFDYYMNFVPYFANLFSPLFVFIAVIFFTSKLAENSEIIAMFSTGMSFKRMLRPYLFSAAVIAVVTFGLGSYVIPKGSNTRINFEDKYYKPRKARSASNIQLEVDTNVVAYIERFETYNMSGYHFSLDKFKDKALVSRLTADRARYDTTRVHHWILSDYVMRKMDGMKEEVSRGTTLDTVLQLEPQDFLITTDQQQMLTSPQLSKYIDRQKQRGFGNIQEFEIEYHRRIAMSFASFILTIIGVSLSSRKRKGGMGLYLGIGLALSFSYILFQTIASTFSVNGGMPAVIAVWIPNVIYAIIAYVLYKRAPQ